MYLLYQFIGGVMRKGRRGSVGMQHVVGIAVGVGLFVLLPVFVVTGAFECAGTAPGLHCAIAKLAFDSTPPAGLQQAKVR